MMGLDNPLHIAFLLVVLLMVFGAKRLPEMGKSLGHGLRGFKDAINPDVAAQPPAVPVLPVLASAQPERAAAEPLDGAALDTDVGHPERERAAA
jgi:sec-independent protein translocase protein TatA